MPKIIKANLDYQGDMKFNGEVRGNEFIVDATELENGDEAGPTPMEYMLQSVAACSGMDVVSILKKKRKTISDLKIQIVGEKRDENPKIFTKANVHYTLTSPDAEEKDLTRSIELSQDKYCGASAMFKLAGCDVTWTQELIRS